MALRRGILGKPAGEWFDLEFEIIQAVATVYEEIEISIPASPFFGMGLEIASIETTLKPSVVQADSDAEWSIAQITKKTKNAIIALSDEDGIIRHEILTIGDSTPDLVGHLGDKKEIRKFDDFGLVILGNSLFVGIDSTDSASVTVYGKLTARLRKLTDAEIGKMTTAEYWST